MRTTHASANYEFVMRCWQREELDALLVRYGLGDVEYFGAYDPAIELGATDRIVAVAQKPGLTLRRSIRCVACPGARTCHPRTPTDPCCA